MVITFRDTIRKVVPPWLRTGVAGKLLYAIGSQWDALTDMAVATNTIGFPGVYSDESLPMLGRERRIRRGRIESAAGYAVRLKRWLTDHRTRGGPYAMLAQLFAYYTGNHFPIRLVYRSGRAFHMDVDGSVVMLDQPWSPDSQPEKWARWWLFYEWPTPVAPAHILGEPGLIVGPTWTLGSGLTPTEVYDLRIVPKEWNAAHAIGNITLVNGGWVLGFPPHILGEAGLVLGGSAPVTIGVS